MNTMEPDLTRGIELIARHSNHEQEEPAGPQVQRLKPADKGRDAWTMLIASLVFEALFWGNYVLAH